MLDRPGTVMPLPSEARPAARPSLASAGSSLVAIAAIVIAVAGAADLGRGVAWSAAAVVVAWSAAATVLTFRRPDVAIGPWSLTVPVSLSLLVLWVSVDGPSPVTGFATAAVPTAVAALLVLAPDGTLAGGRERRLLGTVVVVGTIGGGALAIASPDRPSWSVIVVGLAPAAIGVLAAEHRCRSSSIVDRARLQWIGWGFTVGAAVVVAVLGVRAISGRPDPLAPVVAACGAIPALGLAMTSVQRALGRVGDVLVHTIVSAGLVAFVGIVYATVVVGLSGVPDDAEQTVLALSIAAALVVALTALPVHRWLHAEAERRVRGDDEAPDATLDTFATRMSRAIPMDELLLQLVESLRSTMRLSSAEVWTGADGRYELTVSVPHRSSDRIVLGPESLAVAARAHVQGNAWLTVWIPDLLDGRTDQAVRFVSVAHLGELLGFIVTERNESQSSLDEENEHRVLIDIARQLGLALHNVRLDNALQASLDELKIANDELVASRARIVAATDESRRRIERNLHDGAQQHLVALAVKVGLIRQLLDADPGVAAAMLEELREDVQVTLTELRELAHGIYPPRLRDRGLRDALQAAADRSPLPTRVEAEGLERYGPEIETAIYFCCLEAIQNAGKHAGDGATITVTVREEAGTLEFVVADDGAGFDPATTASSSGFVNMRDRLGAFAGTLDVTSAPSAGACVRGHVPLP